MKLASTEQAAQTFLEDAFERQEGRRPKDVDELVEWSLLKWSEIRSVAPGSRSGGQLLADLAPARTAEFPGLTKGGQE